MIISFWKFHLFLVVFHAGVGIKPVTFTVWWNRATHWGAQHFPVDKALTLHYSKPLPRVILTHQWHFLSKPLTLLLFSFEITSSHHPGRLSPHSAHRWSRSHSMCNASSRWTAFLPGSHRSLWDWRHWLHLLKLQWNKLVTNTECFT